MLVVPRVRAEMRDMGAFAYACNWFGGSRSSHPILFQFALYDASWCLPDRFLTARLFGLGAIFMAFVALSHFFSTHSVGAHGSKTLPLVAIYETTPMICPTDLKVL